MNSRTKLVYCTIVLAAASSVTAVGGTADELRDVSQREAGLLTTGKFDYHQQFFLSDVSLPESVTSRMSSEDHKIHEINRARDERILIHFDGGGSRWKMICQDQRDVERLAREAGLPRESTARISTSQVVLHEEGQSLITYSNPTRVASVMPIPSSSKPFFTGIVEARTLEGVTPVVSEEVGQDRRLLRLQFEKAGKMVHLTVDPALRFRMTRSEVRNHAGQPLTVQQFDDYRQLEGVWLPHKVEQKFFSADGSLRCQIVSTLLNAQVNLDINEDALLIDLPAGTTLLRGDSNRSQKLFRAGRPLKIQPNGMVQRSDNP